MMLRTRPDAAAGLQFALVARSRMVGEWYSPTPRCCQVSLHGARESRRDGASFMRGTAVIERSRKRRGSIAYFRTL